MTDNKTLNIETLCVQAGYQAKNGEPLVLPTAQSTTYKYDDADAVADLFDLKAEGHLYTRISNPTVAAFEEKINTLEGGVGAVATGSGQSANLLAILTIAGAGDNIVAFNNIYGGTYTLLNATLRHFGIETKFVPLNDFEKLAESIDERTKLVFSETLGNPGVEVLDISRAADVAHDQGIPLVVDNTFATPYLCRPFDFGADIVTYSATKFIDGHAATLGGLIVDSGKFPWTEEKFSCLTDEDPNYHGVSYTRDFGDAAYITKTRVVYLRDLGTNLSPEQAVLLNRSLETLALRMDRHSSNALKVAEYLEAHPKVEWVQYPLLKSSKSYDLAQKYLPRGASGVISFGVKGDVEQTKAWINHLKLASLVVHVADTRSHALHPATMTHRQLSEADLEAAGISPNLVRFSVGIEHVEDIIADIAQAFDAI